MTRKLLITLAGLLLLGAATLQAANPETFNVTMTIRQVIQITNTGALDFGTVEQVGATHTVNASAGPHSAGTGAAAATFDVQGENGAVADVSFVTNPITITNGTDNISVTLNAQNTTFTFDGTVQNFFVGGTLTLTGAETTGVYNDTGTAQLQMVYQ